MMASARLLSGTVPSRDSCSLVVTKGLFSFLFSLMGAQPGILYGGLRVKVLPPTIRRTSLHPTDERSLQRFRVCSGLDV
jgi:hypothetical protein